MSGGGKRSHVQGRLKEEKEQEQDQVSEDECDQEQDEEKERHHLRRLAAASSPNFLLIILILLSIARCAGIGEASRPTPPRDCGLTSCRTCVSLHFTVSATPGRPTMSTYCFRRLLPAFLVPLAAGCSTTAREAPSELPDRLSRLEKHRLTARPSAMPVEKRGLARPVAKGSTVTNEREGPLSRKAALNTAKPAPDTSFQLARPDPREGLTVPRQPKGAAYYCDDSQGPTATGGRIITGSWPARSRTSRDRSRLRPAARQATVSSSASRTARRS